MRELNSEADSRYCAAMCGQYDHAEDLCSLTLGADCTWDMFSKIHVLRGKRFATQAWASEYARRLEVLDAG
jgi:hypothetical protein